MHRGSRLSLELSALLLDSRWLANLISKNYITVHFVIETVATVRLSEEWVQWPEEE